MAEFVTSKLSGFLSKYFDNFDSSKVSLSAWANLTLNDLHLKPNVLDQFDLPFRVIGGNVGTLYINVGITGLGWLLAGRASVVEITLSDVHLLAVPPTAFPYDKEKEETDLLHSKRRELDGLDKTAKAALKAVGTKETEPGYVDNIVLTIINNIQVVIKNIHIRYEDNTTKPDTPFSLGLILESLEAQTTDADFVPSTINLEKTFRKLIKLNSTGIYWNSHEKNMISAGEDLSLDTVVAKLKDIALEENQKQLDYVIGPLGTEWKAKVTRNPENLEQPFSEPKAEVNINMPELKIGLSNDQFGEALLLAESVETMKRGIRHRKFRPWNTPYKGHSKQWWKFAIDCTIDQNKKHKEKKKSVWDDVKSIPEKIKLIEEYTKVYEVIAQNPDKEPEEDVKANAEKLEDQLDNLTIMNVRLRVNMIAVREKKYIAANTGYMSWGNYVLTDEDKQKIRDEAMTDEEKQAFNTLDTSELEKPTILPTEVDYAEYIAHIELTKTILNIVHKSVDETDQVTNVMKLQIDKVNVSALTYPVKKGLKVETEIAGMYVTGLEEGQNVPDIMRSLPPTTGAAADNNIPFISVTYEKNPFDSKAASRLKYDSQGFNLIYHAQTVQKLVDTFTWPEHVALAQTTAAVVSSYKKLKQKSAERIKEMAEDTTELEVDLTVIAPRILLPQNGQLSKNSNVLIVNMGTLTLKSVPKDKDEVKNADPGSNGTAITKTEGELTPEILSQYYNQFDVKLADFEILLGSSGNSISSALSEPDEPVRAPTNLLKKGQILVDLDQCKIQTDPRFPKIKIKVQIPMLEVDISEENALQLMHIAITFPIPKLAERKVDPAFVPEVVDSSTSQAAEDAAELKELLSVELAQHIQSVPVDPESVPQMVNLDLALHVEGITCRISKLDPSVSTTELQPAVDIVIAEIKTSVNLHTFGNRIEASLGKITATYCGASIVGYDGPINLLDTGGGLGGNRSKENVAALLTFRLTTMNDDCPKEFRIGDAQKRIEVKITSLDLILHQESLVSLLNAAQRLSSELELIKMEQSKPRNRMIVAGGSIMVQKKDGVGKDKAGQEKPLPPTFDILMLVNASLTSFTVQLTSEEKRIADIQIKALIVDYEDASKSSTVRVKLGTLEILDLDIIASTSKYSKILSVNCAGEECGRLIEMEAVIFKSLDDATIGETDPNMTLNFTLGGPRLIIIGSFFGNLMNFANNFKAVKKAVAPALAEASEKRLKIIRNAIEKSGYKIKLQIVIGAPAVYVPKSSESLDSLVLILGEFKITNKLSTVPVEDETGRKLNAISDKITFQMSGIRGSRATLDENLGIIAELICIEPISYQVKLTRSLSNLCTSIPQFKIGVTIQEVIVKLGMDDVIFAVDCLIDKLETFMATQSKAHKPDILISGSGDQGGATNDEIPDENQPSSASAETVLLLLDASLKMLGLTIYTGSISLENQVGVINHDEAQSLGQLALQHLDGHCDLRTNMDFSLNLTLFDILFRDSRPDATGIINFIQRTKMSTDKKVNGGDRQAMISIDFKQTMLPGSTGDKIYFVNVENTSIEILLNLDFVHVVMVEMMGLFEALPNLIARATKSIQSGKSEGGSTSKQNKILTSGSIEEKPKPLMLVDGQIRLNKINIYLLDDVHATDTNAINVNVEVSIDFQTENGKSFGNGIIRMGCSTSNYSTKGGGEHLSQILRPHEIGIKIGLGSEIPIDIELTFSGLSLRLTSGTLLIISKIATSISGMLGKAKTVLGRKDEAEINYSTVWNPKQSDAEKYWFLKPETTTADSIVVTGSKEEIDTPTVKDTTTSTDRVVHQKVKAIIKTMAISLEVGAGSMTIALVAIDCTLNAEVTNWSSDLMVTGALGMSAAYNNTESGVWEYILEPIEVPASHGELNYKPWELKFQVSQPQVTNSDALPPKYGVVLFSEDMMEVTLSKTALSAIKKVATSMGTSVMPSVSENDLKAPPYTFTNGTGFPLTLKVEETSPFMYLKGWDELNKADIDLAPGQTVDLALNINISAAENNKAQAERNLTIVIPEFKFNQTVNVGRTETRFFAFDKEINDGLTKEEIPAGVLVEVASNDFTIGIIVRGIVKFVSEVGVPIEMFTDEGESLGTIPPEGVFSVPIRQLYTHTTGFKIKPKGYGLSPTPLTLTNLRGLTEAVHNWPTEFKNDTENGMAAHLKVIGEGTLTLEGNTDAPSTVKQNFTVSIRPQVVVNNLLPMTLIISSPEADTVPEAGSLIVSGRSFKCFDLPETGYNDYSFNLKLLGFRGTDWRSNVRVQSSDEIVTSCVFTSVDGAQKICFGYMTEGKDPGKGPLATVNDAVTIYVYCPYWMVNYTGLDLTYKSSDGETEIPHPAGEQGPFIFAPETGLGKKALFKCTGSDWSSAVDLEANTGIPNVISLNSGSDGANTTYQMTLSSDFSSFKLTRIVTLSAKYSLINTCPYDLVVRESNEPPTMTKIPKHQSIPFWPKGNVDTSGFAISVGETQEFTRLVSYKNSGLTLLKLNNKYGGIRVSIDETPTRVSITLSEYDVLEATILIVNDTKTDTIQFNQAKEVSKRELGPGQSVHYEWDNTDDSGSKDLEWITLSDDAPVNVVGATPPPDGTTADNNTPDTAVAEGDAPPAATAAETTPLASGAAQCTVSTDKLLKQNMNGEWTNPATNQSYKWVAFVRGLQPTLVITQNDEEAKNLVDNLQAQEQAAGKNERPTAAVEFGLSGIGISIVDNVAGLDILYCRIGSKPATWESSFPGQVHFRLVPPDENEILEKGFQNRGNLPTGPTKLTDTIEVDYENFTINHSAGTGHILWRHEARRGIQVNVKIFPSSSLELAANVNLIQIDNQLYNAKHPILLSISPIQQTPSTESEVHPFMIHLEVKKQSTPDSSMDLISGKFEMQEFDIRADTSLILTLMSYISIQPTTWDGKTKEQYDEYNAAYVIASAKEKGFYAKQMQSVAGGKAIILEDIDMYKIKFNLTFAMAAGSIGSLTALFTGLGSVLVDMTNKGFIISGLAIRHARLTPEEFVNQAIQHYYTQIILNVVGVVLGLELLGNPVRLLSGLGNGLFTLLADPVRAVAGGHYIDGVLYAGQGLGQVVGSVTGAVGGIVGTLGKVTDVLGLGYVLGSRGLLGGLAYVLHAPSALCSADMSEHLVKVREPRSLKAGAVLKPYSKWEIVGRSLITQLGGSADDYIFHCLTEESHFLLLSNTMAYFAKIKEDMATLEAEVWNTADNMVVDVVIEENGIVLHMKPTIGGWFRKKEIPPRILDQIIINDKIAREWVFGKILEIVEKMTPPEIKEEIDKSEHETAPPPPEIKEEVGKLEQDIVK